MLNEIKEYKARQVVINHYIDEELVSKTGFLFDYIIIDKKYILFYRQSEVVHELYFANGIIIKENSFPNYFVLHQDLSEIQIYFP